LEKCERGISKDWNFRGEAVLGTRFTDHKTEPRFTFVLLLAAFRRRVFLHDAGG
jgi:hypothetical protein